MTKSTEECGLREFTYLFFPIALVTFSQCVFLFIEKLLLARLSVESLEAAVSSSYVVQVFQAPCVALAMMAQVFVARYLGAKEFNHVGPAIWQFIWFSFLSMIITIPCGMIFAELYFHGMPIKETAIPYLYSLLFINFLYPLTATLSCFYLGRGKTHLLLWGTIGSQLAKLLLAYLFIFGWENIIPSFGLLGGVLSTFIAQSGFCILLISVFLKKTYRDHFHSHKWKFRPKQFWHYIQPGLFRAFNRILNFGSWSAITYLMASKGGFYLTLMSVGGTYFIFLPFLGDAINQVQITVTSRLIGAKHYHLLNKAFHSGILLSFIVIGIFSIPLLLFPHELYLYLFPNITLPRESISALSFGIWLSFAGYTLTMVPVSYILAFKDMKFSFFMGFFGWLNGFFLIYVALQIISIPADYFWLTLSLMHASTGLMYYLRMKKLESQTVFAT